ncbi:MAG TPA: hypothetical protein VJB67_03630, partial [Patescibacteria group bacterium]|nr:hypothetical protein [Patescibacteria group bacterium]
DCQLDNLGYCDSDKAKLTRDTKRLADVQAINLRLEDYYNQLRCANDHSRYCTDSSNCECGHFYPNLSAGTYITGRSFSVWPSWQATLGNALGSALPTDPFNRLADCVSPYDSITCWDEIAKLMQKPGDDSFVYTYYLGADSKGVYAHGEYNENGDKWHTDWAGIAYGKNINPNIFAGFDVAAMARPAQVSLGVLGRVAGAFETQIISQTFGFFAPVKIIGGLFIQGFKFMIDMF